MGLPIPQPRDNCASPGREECTGGGCKDEDKGKMNPNGVAALNGFGPKRTIRDTKA